jgi:hypothetical protein
LIQSQYPSRKHTTRHIMPAHMTLLIYIYTPYILCISNLLTSHRYQKTFSIPTRLLHGDSGVNPSAIVDVPPSCRSPRSPSGSHAGERREGRRTRERRARVVVFSLPCPPTIYIGGAVRPYPSTKPPLRRRPGERAAAMGARDDG